MAKIFGNFHKIVANDELRPSLNYAVVRDGNIVGTDGHVLVKTPLIAWVEYEEQLQHLEGKALHYRLLMKLAATKWKLIEFAEDKINFYTNPKGEIVESEYYSAICINTATRDYHIIDTRTGELCFKPLEDNPDQTEPDIFRHPNIDGVIPNLFHERNSFNELGVNYDYLTKLGECFRGCEHTKSVRLQFTPQPKDEPSSFPTRGIIVTPIKNEWDEFGMIMPVKIE